MARFIGFFAALLNLEMPADGMAKVNAGGMFLPPKTSWNPGGAPLARIGLNPYNNACWK